MTNETLRVELADLDLPEHAAAVTALVDAYARDPWGDGKPLADGVRQRLVPALREHPTTLVLLAWLGDEPIGVAVSFLGFSTFAARPLLNLHDLAVTPAARGRGVGRKLLEALESVARERGCCKLTLEVLEKNRRAKRLYEEFGFAQATYAEDGGSALFYAKKLSG